MTRLFALDLALLSVTIVPGAVSADGYTVITPGELPT